MMKMEEWSLEEERTLGSNGSEGARPKGRKGK